MRKSQARQYGDKPMRVTDVVGLYGSEGWMDPMTKQVGPVAQTQVYVASMSSKAFNLQLRRFAI